MLLAFLSVGLHSISTECSCSYHLWHQTIWSRQTTARSFALAADARTRTFQTVPYGIRGSQPSGTGEALKISFLSKLAKGLEVSGDVVLNNFFLKNPPHAACAKHCVRRLRQRLSRSTYRACYNRRSSLPGGCCICLEQSAGDSTIIAVIASFLQ